MRIHWLLAALVIPGLSMAAEGMWTLDNLPTKKIQAEYGFTPNAEWANHAMLGSVRIAGGCSASFISKDGLVMTNHHCAQACLSQLSTAKQNYIKDGFLAKAREDEAKCPEIELNRLEQIKDVTTEVKKATAGLDGEKFKLAQNAVNAQLTSACVGNDKDMTRCDVVDLYHGGRYHLYKYHRFQDTRVVWAPEFAAAFFGGDPDNFNFPRYNLDITLLRAYENGKPAVVKDFFPFNKDGAKEGELVFVTGHPGSTQRQLSMAQLITLRDTGLIPRLQQLAELRGVLTQYGKTSPEAARTSESLLFGIENSYKALNGQLSALLDAELIRKMQADETALRKFVASKASLKASTGGAWDAIEKAELAYRNMQKPFQMIEGSQAFNSNHYRFARTLVRGADERVKPNGERLPEFADARLPEVEQRLFSKAPVYPEFEKVKLTFSLTKMREILGADSAYVKQVLGKQSPEQLAAAMVDGSKLADPAVRKALWTGGKDAVAKSDDPFIKLALALDADSRAMRKRYEKEVDSVVQKNSELISQARFAMQGTGAYPDATFTLRLSYGEVKGWNEAGSKVTPFTNFAGAFARDTGADPFALPASWHAKKDKLDLSKPYNFVTTNDIIGGNSGSPVINKKGEVVGLIFDGNIHSLGGAFWFDPRYNRSVAVHSGAILEALDKIYGASELTREIAGN